jgi:hypothetical protein
MARRIVCCRLNRPISLARPLRMAIGGIPAVGRDKGWAVATYPAHSSNVSAKDFLIVPLRFFLTLWN